MTIILIIFLVGCIIYLLANSLYKDVNVFVYEPYSSEEEYIAEVKWFIYQPLSAEPYTDREKRVIIALAKKMGKESMVNFKWVDNKKD